MLRVGFDTSGLVEGFKSHAGRGIGRYVQELNSYFQRYNEFGHEVYTDNKILYNQSHPGIHNQTIGVKDHQIYIENFDYQWFSLPGSIERAIKMLPAGKQTIRQQIVYPFQLNSKRMQHFDVLHFPAHMDAPVRSSKPYIITVLDLIPLKFKELYEPQNPGWRFRFARFLELQAIKNSSLIIAISECTARDIHTILGIPYEKIRVTRLGINQNFSRSATDEEKTLFIQKYHINPDRPKLLYIGGIDQRKNWKMLLATLKGCIEASAEAQKPLPELIIAGRIKDDKQYPLLLEEIKRLSLSDHVRLLGFIDDGEMQALFGISSVFLFPSLYEGFGFPPLEAMAAGLPVVSSNTSCMPDTLGDAALFADPNDYESFIYNTLSMLSNEALRNEYIRKGKIQSSTFTWEATGEKTIDVYREYFERTSALTGNFFHF
jgi:glycosyltransferase involved in cell wall biosynthesis